MVTFFKKYLPIILSVLLLAGVAFGIYKLTTIETKTVLPTVFTRGGVDSETGELVENKQKLVTRDFLECKGLQIESSFDSNLKYQIFWYNEDKIYFAKTEEFNQNTKFVSKDVPSAAVYCHIVISPTIYDEDGLEDSSAEIAFYEPLKYASKLKIKVNIKQDLKAPDLARIARLNPANKEDALSLNMDEQYYSNLYFEGFVKSGSDITYNNFNSIDTSLNSNFSIYKFDCSKIGEFKILYEDIPSYTTYFYKCQYLFTNFLQNISHFQKTNLQ